MGHAAVRAGDDVAPGNETHVGQHAEHEVFQLAAKPIALPTADRRHHVGFRRALRRQEHHQRVVLAVAPPVARRIGIGPFEVLHGGKQLPVESLAKAGVEAIGGRILSGRGQCPEHGAAVEHPGVVMEDVVVAELQGAVRQGLQLLPQGRFGPIVESGVAVQPVVGQGHVGEGEIDEERVVDRLRVVGHLPGAKNLQCPLRDFGPAGEEVDQRERRGLGRLEAFEPLEHLLEVGVAGQCLELPQGNGAASFRRAQQQPWPIALDAVGRRNQLRRRRRQGQRQAARAGRGARGAEEHGHLEEIAPSAAARLFWLMLFHGVAFYWPALRTQRNP